MMNAMTELSTLTGNKKAPVERKLLVLCDGHVTEHELPASGVLVIGRGQLADVVIDHPTLSRSHAKLTIAAHMTIEDCGSRNGTVVNGRSLASGEVVLVAPGAPIEIGEALLVVRAGTGGADVLATSDGSRNESGRRDRAIARIAAVDVSVLIGGEAGAGKTFLASQVHAASSRRSGPFVVLRCAAVQSGSEIMAAAASARGGILLVHEPSTLSPTAQAALTTAIDSVKGDVRTIAVTSRDLAPLVQRGAFAPELLHRLATLSIAIPPLRARLRELPLLAQSIVSAVAAENHRPAPLISGDALAALGRHGWPGNVRELKMALTRAVLLGSVRVLTAAHFELAAADQAAGAGSGTLSSAVSEAEHRRILEALRDCSNNQTRAAKMLGISRGTLISRLERYAVPRPRK